MATELITTQRSTILLPFISPTPKMVFETYTGAEIKDELLNRCAKLFSDNYGVWGESPVGKSGAVRGTRVKMTGRGLREQCVTDPARTVLVACYQRDMPDNHGDFKLVGHAFSSVWDFNDGRVGWVTQLVVSVETRRRYIATSLLQMLKSCPLFHSVTAVGLVSSHPSACHALAKYTHTSIHNVNTDFCRHNAEAIIGSSPIEYVRDMLLRGSLFQENCSTGAVSSALTGFFVDHREPLAALAAYKSSGPWVLGELLEGHEFLIICPIW